MSYTITAQHWTTGETLTGVYFGTRSKVIGGMVYIDLVVDGFDVIARVPAKTVADLRTMSSFYKASDEMLWKIADENVRGFGEVALAELQRREVRELNAKQAAEREQRRHMQYCADRLTGRAA